MSAPYMISIKSVFFMASLKKLNTGLDGFIPAVTEMPDHTSQAAAFEKYRASLEAFAQVMESYKQLLTRDAGYLKEVHEELGKLDSSMANGITLLP